MHAASSAEIGTCDAVLFCLKSYDAATAAAEHLPSLVGDSTVVVPLQNGIDAADGLAAVVGAARVLGGWQ